MISKQNKSSIQFILINNDNQMCEVIIKGYETMNAQDIYFILKEAATQVVMYNNSDVLIGELFIQVPEIRKEDN